MVLRAEKLQSLHKLDKTHNFKKTCSKENKINRLNR